MPACRACGGTRFMPYVDLGMQPLANALKPAADTSVDARYPLAVRACLDCLLLQLTHVVPAETLYTRYAYWSGVSPAWRAHCESLAATYGRKDAFVVDVASNDGTLLAAFAARGCKTLGIEPARDFGVCDYPRIADFWSAALARRARLKGRVDILTATNVFGHVDDAHDFMAGVATALAPTGIAIIEVPTATELVKTGAFDTIYHEHVSYWSAKALQLVARTHGLTLAIAEPLDVHGGSMRFVLTRRPASTGWRVTRMLTQEARALTPATLFASEARIRTRIRKLDTALRDVVPYRGFGAAAKTTVTLNALECGAHPELVYDDSPYKHGKRVPGTRVPIVAPEPGYAGPLVLFAWNWAADLIPRLRAGGFSGPIFVPFPSPRWIA